MKNKMLTKKEVKEVKKKKAAMIKSKQIITK